MRRFKISSQAPVCPEDDAQGQWVRYSDHEAELAELMDSLQAESNANFADAEHLRESLEGLKRAIDKHQERRDPGDLRGTCDDIELYQTADRIASELEPDSSGERSR